MNQKLEKLRNLAESEINEWMRFHEDIKNQIKEIQIDDEAIKRAKEIFPKDWGKVNINGKKVDFDDVEEKLDRIDVCTFCGYHKEHSENCPQFKNPNELKYICKICNKPGYHVHTGTTITTEKFAKPDLLKMSLKPYELKQIQQILVYCKHRLEKHHSAGIKYAISLKELEKLIKKFI